MKVCLKIRQTMIRMTMRRKIEYCGERENIVMGERKVNGTVKPEKVMENLWLRYFNSVLLKKGVITEAAYKRMEREILNRSASGKKDCAVPYFFMPVTACFLTESVLSDVRNIQIFSKAHAHSDHCNFVGSNDRYFPDCTASSETESADHRTVCEFLWLSQG